MGKNNNLSLKLVSLVLAIFIWFIITDIDDPIQTKTFRDVPIKVVNKESIEEKNKVVNIPINKIDVKVKARKSVLLNMTSNDILAKIDLLELYDLTSSVKVRISTFKSVEEIYAVNSDFVVVTVDEKMKKTLPITVQVTGQPKKDYAVTTLKATPNILVLEGSKKIIDTISRAVSYLDVDGYKKEITSTEKIILYDTNNNIVDINSNLNSISLSVSQAEIKADIKPTKTIPIRINLVGNPKYGYKVTKREFVPKEIEIASDRNILEKINELNIPVNIDDVDSSVEEAINVKDFLPENIYIDNNTKCMVNLVVEKIVDREIKINKDDIIVYSDLDIIIEELEENTMKISGGSSEIAEIVFSDLQPYIDVSNLDRGKHIVKLQYKNKNIKILSDIEVKIEIK